MSDNRWYFTEEQLANSPSRKCGINAEQELSYRQRAANLIQEMGQRLQVYVYIRLFLLIRSFACDLPLSVSVPKTSQSLWCNFKVVANIVIFFLSIVRTKFREIFMCPKSCKKCRSSTENMLEVSSKLSRSRVLSMNPLSDPIRGRKHWNAGTVVMMMKKSPYWNYEHFHHVGIFLRHTNSREPKMSVISCCLDTLLTIRFLAYSVLGLSYASTQRSFTCIDSMPFIHLRYFIEIL